jgi:EAL domain-containing protein (putative c-di-GMP-specific phosphodiesterase class I)
MSVNLSGKHFADPSLVEQVEKIVEETAIDPQCVKLEITESSTMEDAENAIQKLNELKKSGVHLSIDDFGTGYSSLSYLRRLPVDTLKIDRSFVSAMDEASESDEIVRTIMALANSLKLNVVAEGIENVQQLAILRRLGCQFGQGYLFAPPLPLEAVETMLKDGADWSRLADGLVLPGDPGSTDLSSLEFTN